MSTDNDPGRKRRAGMIERRARKIIGGRSVTIGLALTFLGLAFVGGIVIYLLDKKDFPTVGLAIWWALQTVTTVGYGDITPKSDIGRVIGGIEMVIGVSFIAFLTAAVTSAVVRSAQAEEREQERQHLENTTQRILDAVGDTNQRILELETRLGAIESELTARRGDDRP